MQRETAIIFLAELGGVVTKDLGFEQAKDFIHFIDELADMIKEQEPIVRCKDCKKIGYTNSHWFCKWLNRCVDEDWFCADGLRNESKKSNSSEIPNS